MRAQIGLSLAVVTLVGCSVGTPSKASETGSRVPSVDARANGRTACLAVQKAAVGYGTDILNLSGSELTAKTKEWSSQISRTARNVNDTMLRTALLSLADVVRGWATRPPDRTAVRGFQYDLNVACHPYLTAASS